MINVGIIGCGSITKYRHAPEYNSNKDSQIKGFYDPKPERVLDMTGTFGGRIYKSIDEMLGDKDIDAVSVCTANVFHAPITIQALKAGKHVLCEKPMAISVEECKRMIEASEETGKILMIGHNQRFVPAHIKAKEILKSGEVGELLTFRTTFGHGGPEMWSADKSSSTWFFKKNTANFGVIGDLGIHKVDLIIWLMEDDIAEVTTVTATLDKKDETDKFIEVDDNAMCILKSKRGIIGSLTASWTNYGDEDNSTVLYCTKGVIKICCNKDYPVIVEKRNDESRFYKLGSIQTNDNQTNSGIIDTFVKSIVNAEKSAISGSEGLEVMKVVFACMESASKGEAVKIC